MWLNNLTWKICRGVEAKCFKGYNVSGGLKHLGVKTFGGLTLAEGKYC